MNKRSFVLPFFLLLFVMPASSQWKPWNDLPAHCSHIIVLKGEEDRRLAEGVQWGEAVQLMYPGPRALAATREALSRMTPLLCQSIRRIAFGRYTAARGKTGAVNSFGAGDLVLINVAHERFYEEDLEKRSSQLMLQQTLLHEASHAAETLLATESKDGGPRGYGGSWTLGARNLARKTIEKARLENGLYKEWQRLHRSFQGQRWAAGYGNDAYQRTEQALREILKKPTRFEKATPSQIAEAGFMNAYGASNWAEDLATFVGNVYVGPAMAAGIKSLPGVSEDLRLDTACRELQRQTDRNVPAKLSAVYAKLMFLLDMGFVKEEDVAKCTGPRFGLLDVTGPGFHIFEKGKLLRSIDMNVKAGMGSKGVFKVFEMAADGKAEFGGKTYPATMKLSLAVGTGEIEKSSWPRGVYKLGMIGPNKLELRLDGAPAGNFDAREGYVLVASSSGELISGSVFLTQAWRPHAPLPVPQVFDPPLNIRFQLKK